MINVVNKYKHIPNNNSMDFYIGRGSPLGNQYTSIKDRKTKALFICDSPEESISKFEIDLIEKIKQKDKIICTELNRIYLAAKQGDVNLLCFCAPRPCHGNVIKKIIEEKLNLKSIKMNDESIIPFGKFKGEKLANVPPDYLLWLFENNKCFGNLKQYIEENLDVIKSEIEYRKKKS